MTPLISVLVVNLNNLEYTKNCINDLLTQDIIFNLKLIDQNSVEGGTKEYFESLFRRYIDGEFKDKIINLEIINSGFNKPLNHIWNEFVKESKTKFVCLLNNDVRICSNFLSSSISVLEKEEIVKVVNHTTNNINYSNCNTELSYDIKYEPYRQGWDIVMRKSDWIEIPHNLEFFYGDDFIYSKIYLDGFKGAYVLNSPVIHFERSTTEEKNGKRDLSVDQSNYYNMISIIPKMTFDETYSKWKPQFDFFSNLSVYSKENYITRDADVSIWEEHLNTKILDDYKNLLYGNVADFGCNHGATTIIASRNENIKNIVGIDINYDALKIANDLKDKHKVTKLTYHHTNLVEMSEIPTNYFDSAYSFHTLEHINPDDYDSIFNEWCRVIKNGGHFIISIPYERAYDDPTHMAYFNETSLRKLFEKYKFEVIECYRDNRDGFDCLNLVSKNIKMDNEILLSILIPSLYERNEEFLSKLLHNIDNQIKGKPVELIILSDNAKRPIGTKRNDMIKLAKGKYVCFIDDDDRISDDYVDLVLGEINKWSPDVVVFDALISFDGKTPKLVKYGREYDYGETSEYYTRHPNHLMVHKRENITELFKDLSFGEDDEWALRMLPRIVTQSRIDKTLYFYDYSTTTKKYFQ